MKSLFPRRCWHLRSQTNNGLLAVSRSYRHRLHCEAAPERGGLWEEIGLPWDICCGDGKTECIGWYNWRFNLWFCVCNEQTDSSCYLRRSGYELYSHDVNQRYRDGLPSDVPRGLFIAHSTEKKPTCQVITSLKHVCLEVSESHVCIVVENIHLRISWTQFHINQ